MARSAPPLAEADEDVSDVSGVEADAGLLPEERDG